MHPGIPHGLLRLSGFRELRPQPGPPLLVITYPYPPTLPCVLQRSHTKVRISRQGVMLHRCLSPILFFSFLVYHDVRPLDFSRLHFSHPCPGADWAQEWKFDRIRSLRWGPHSHGKLHGATVARDFGNKLEGGPAPSSWTERERREGPRVKKNSAHSLRYHPQPQKTKIPCPQKSPSKRVSFTAAQCSPSLFIF